jgi:hypothetical protein
MAATAMASSIDNLTLTVTEEIFVNASIEKTFAALLEQLGPGAEQGDGKPMAMVVETWPGGRWYRDLGDNNGHFWAHVQAIKRPTLLEMTGPMFMSYPVAANIQYRLSEKNGGTLITFHHKAFGLISDEHRQGVTKGWAAIHTGVRKRAEAKNAN